ncbi:MAG: T9SS type B sorting domain-containing protein [Bacteroidetes bacterium]|jgi:gliding motility-associated-like protein|nr:T9SS type B sorting domain-containing protein [Bacteroidota bacterium]MBT6684918.1 T9SS type B sorting domain-containing protein [Bacteroidota bacterium]MBT7145223.1 T9SS type B sorting domain-containing protein [Bacteroidota bacterium]
MLKKFLLILLVIYFAFNISFSQDTTPPEPVEIDSVSVLTTDMVRISWEMCTSLDVDGYYIYLLIDAAKVPIDTIPNGSTITLLHNWTKPPAPSTDTQSETYFVAPFDNSDNVAEMSAPHNTMFLQYYFEPCYAKTRLSWNEYINWDNGVKEYQIFVKRGSAPYTLLSLIEGTQTSFIHSHLDPSITYKYFVRAINDDQSKTSKSNIIEIYTDMPRPPEVLNAEYATVSGNNIVKLSFYIDLNADIIKHCLARSNSFHGFYDTIKVFPFDGTVFNRLSHTDYINTESEIYYYKLIAINTCNVEIEESNIVNNIVLNTTSNIDLSVDLDWNSVEDWIGQTKEYEIIRTIDGEYLDTIVDIVKNGQVIDIYDYFYDGDVSFIDKVENIIYNYPNIPDGGLLDIENIQSYWRYPEQSGKFCYQVKAVENLHTVYANGENIEFQGESSSNWSCATLQSRISVPNAFTPDYDGLNDIFLPRVLFTDLNNYSFEIYNRWGELIFQTKNTFEGWDGTINNEMAPRGTYIYFIKYTSAFDNKAFEKGGHVTLIR